MNLSPDPSSRLHRDDIARAAALSKERFYDVDVGSLSRAAAGLLRNADIGAEHRTADGAAA